MLFIYIDPCRGGSAAFFGVPQLRNQARDSGFGRLYTKYHSCSLPILSMIQVSGAWNASTAADSARQ